MKLLFLHNILHQFRINTKQVLHEIVFKIHLVGIDSPFITVREVIDPRLANEKRHEITS